MLPDISTNLLSGQGERVEITAPFALEALPREWSAKLGTYRFPDWRVAELHDVSLCGPASVGIKGGDVVLDVGYYGRLDLWERNAPYYEMALQAIRQPAIEIEYAASLISCWSGNYFHWVLDELPKLGLIAKHAMRTGEQPVLLAPMNVSFVDDSLRRLFPGWEVIKIPYGISHYKVKRLAVATTRRSRGRMAPSAASYLRGLSAEFHEAYSCRRIYVSRKLARHRRVVNEEDVAEALLERGFTILTNEVLDFEEQVRQYAHAEYVIGPHGAGLANMLWSNHPGMKVIELVTPAYSNPCCWLAGAAMGADYGMALCDPIGDEDMIVDIDKLIRLMELMDER